MSGDYSKYFKEENISWVSCVKCNSDDFSGFITKESENGKTWFYTICSKCNNIIRGCLWDDE